MGMNSIRNVVRVVAIANLAYFFVEFSFAVRIGSVSLFADSIDFLEDEQVMEDPVAVCAKSNNSGM